MLVELRKARGLIFRWADRYQEAVLAGLMSLEESVRLVLCDDDVRPFTCLLYTSYTASAAPYFSRSQS